MGRNCIVIGCTYACDSAPCTLMGPHCQRTVPSRPLIGTKSRCNPTTPSASFQGLPPTLPEHNPPRTCTPPEPTKLVLILHPANLIKYIVYHRSALFFAVDRQSSQVKSGQSHCLDKKSICPFSNPTPPHHPLPPQPLYFSTGKDITRTLCTLLICFTSNE